MSSVTEGLKKYFITNTLPPGKTRYPFYRRLGGPQGQFGQAENLAPPGFNPGPSSP